jgi:indolepyruvate ferredoxin oxidoreductase
MTETLAPPDRPAAHRRLRLADRYLATSGPVLLTGVQAMCRVPVDVRRVDDRRGLRTRAFLSGYQGSPLGTVDFALRPMRVLLDELGVDFRPGVNESLAATAVLGTQSVPDIGSPYQGIAGFWYGKAPGLDQALDPIRHGNLMGTHPDGGVLAFVGDDASAKSSTVPSSSEATLRAALVPVLSPADSHDVVAFGLHGIALSRACGLWAAMKIATSVADGSSVADLDIDGFDPVIPTLDGRPYRHAVVASPVAQRAVDLERSLFEVRLPLALAYARANRLNTVCRGGPSDRFGIAAAGKIYLEVRQALLDLGLDDAALARLGIRLLKVGMPWPLEPDIVREFGAGLHEVVVVEEKGPFLELLVRDVLFDLSDHPRVYGGRGPDGAPLFAQSGELDADTIAKGLGPRLLAHFGDIPSVRARLVRLGRPQRTTLAIAKRAPYFCSGCPHNRSTKAPDGSLVGAGIGCHGMALMMEPSQAGEVTGLTQMGGEGAQWIGQALYTDATHLFQNLGDGTLAHSGLLAIRAAVAAGVNITYKILFNATVAMTGGQDAQGGYAVPQLTRTLAAEGVARTVITTDDPAKYRGVKLAPGAVVRHRDDLIAVQEELRAIAGVTVLIHDQACAAELRRKRKRKQVPDPVRRAVINERICEGCGDCGRKSNCLSVVPVDTEFGRKTQIDQASCNKDYSCLDGECPSFLEVTPGTKAPVRTAAPLAADDLPPVGPQALDGDYTIRITGIGGTGVVTVAQVLATAGFADGLLPNGLDQVGLSQKAGPVVSDLKLSTTAAERSNRAGAASADLYLGCDLLVAADPGNLRATDPERSIAVVSTADVPSGAMIRRPETALPDHSPMTLAIDAATRAAGNVYIDARALSQLLFGTDQLANMLLVGAAYQAGGLPLSEDAIEQAIELNGVAVEANVQAFRRGRQAVADPDALAVTLAELRAPAARPGKQPSVQASQIVESVGASELADVLALRVQDLIEYQNATYARRYADAVTRVRQAEQQRTPGSDRLTRAVAVNLHKLMAYKDEYEVARLALDEDERAKVRAEFGPDAKVVWKLHPPILKALGMRKKISLGAWFLPVFVVLRWLKWLRGTPLDVFGYARVRRTERRLIADYLRAVDTVLDRLGPDTHAAAVRIAELPDLVRGYEEVKMANVAAYDEQLRTLLGAL